MSTFKEQSLRECTATGSSVVALREHSCQTTSLFLCCLPVVAVYISKFLLPESLTLSLDIAWLGIHC